MEPGREGATLGDRRAEFDNTHDLLLSGSYLSPAGKAYGMFLPSGQNSSCGKAAAFYFSAAELHLPLIFSTTLVAPWLYDDMGLRPIVLLALRHYSAELLLQHSGE